MNRSIALGAFGHATSLFLAISFTLCVACDLLMPGYQMHPAWERLLPGFTWISWGSFFLGLVESYAYGWYITLIWVPLYNVAVNRRVVAEDHRSKGFAVHAIDKRLSESSSR